MVSSYHKILFLNSCMPFEFLKYRKLEINFRISIKWSRNARAFREVHGWGLSELYLFFGLV